MLSPRTKSSSQLPPNTYPPISAQRNTKPKWFIFPDELPNGEFRGFENRKDATMVRGAFVLGQNIKFRDSGLPTLRDGFKPIGAELSNAYPVDRAWIFETRNGDVYEIKAYNGSLYYLLVGTSTDYSLLQSGYTADEEFGYANIGESSGLFHTMFCNGIDPWNEFNGAWGIVKAVTATTIQITGGIAFNALPVPFYTSASGTPSVIINGVVFPYTSGEGSDTITVSVDPTLNGITPGMLLVQSPRVPTFRIFFPFLTVASGAFVVGETITGASGKTAKVQRVAPDNTYIVVTNPSGAFVPGELITGGTSSVTATLAGSLDQTLGPPLSSVVMAHLSRIHCRNELKKSVWAYSMLDDPYTWTVFGLDTSGGSKDIEFGGAITAFGRLNQTAVAYKKRGITSLDFVQTGTLTDVPRYMPLIQGDDKGTTLGAIGQRSTFSSPFGMISMTQDGKMILLASISENDQPNYTIISDPIQPVFNAGNHLDASGECVDGVLWYSFKSSSSSASNDTTITGDLRRKTVDAYGNEIPLRWDLPSVGQQVRDWTAIPDGTGGAQVHWHSSLNSNSYAIDETAKVDNGGGFTANLQTWAELFSAPEIRKRADRGFIEILMRENSVVNAALLLDENGFTGIIAKVLNGNQTKFRFGNTPYNPYGSSVYGSQKIGSNGLIEDRQRYRFYFELKETPLFFNMSLSLESDTENSDFELIRWGVRITSYEPQTPKELGI